MNPLQLFWTFFLQKKNFVTFLKGFCKLFFFLFYLFFLNMFCFFLFFSVFVLFRFFFFCFLFVVFSLCFFFCFVFSFFFRFFLQNEINMLLLLTSVKVNSGIARDAFTPKVALSGSPRTATLCYLICDRLCDGGFVGHLFFFFLKKKKKTGRCQSVTHKQHSPRECRRSDSSSALEIQQAR